MWCKFHWFFEASSCQREDVSAGAHNRRCLANLIAAIFMIAAPATATGAQVSSAREAMRSTGIALRLEHTFAAPRERVFRAWLDPEAIRRWFVYNVEAHWSPEPAVEAKTGGGFNWGVILDSDKAAFRFHGTYREIKTPEKLVFTWVWDSLPIAGVDGPGNTVVSVEFLSQASETRIVLEQVGFPSEAAREAHQKGWERCLAGMTILLARDQPQVVRPASEYVRVQSGVIALEHVRVIDGTGAEPRLDQTIVLAGNEITAIGHAGSVVIPENATRLGFSGYTAIPGLVGMHDHLFYSANYFHSDGKLAYSMPFSYPRLYLGSGVTTIRTTGSFEPYTDLEIKKAIDGGESIGPKMNVTGPYLEGEPFPLIQIHKLTGPDDARRTVDYWAAEGAGSFKAYADITRAELAAAIEEVHKYGLTITGHLCSIGFREAAEMGIDNLEHGLFVDTEFVQDRQPDRCPNPGNATAADLPIDGEAIQTTIKILVDHHVALTSTLPVYEEFVPSRPDAPQRVLDALSDAVRSKYQVDRQTRRAAMGEGKRTAEGRELQRDAVMLKKEMEFERAFVRAGGLLMTGPDGVLGGDIAGFGDQRGVELLVEAGFTPVEAIKIATLNGALFLKLADRIGSLDVGKQADIVVVKGDPSANIKDIENVEVVFKNGVGYDSKKLIESVKGQVGIR